MNSKAISKELSQIEPENRTQTLSNFQQQLVKVEWSFQDLRVFWKGLYYAVWQSDKQVNQQALILEISKITLFLQANKKDLVSQWIKAGYSVLKKEWNKIDYYRMNKFMSLVRNLFKYMLLSFAEEKWRLEPIQQHNTVLREEIFSAEDAEQGIRTHYIQIFVQEVAQMKDVPIQAQLQIFQLFTRILIEMDDRKVHNEIKKWIYEKMVELKNEEKLPNIDVKSIFTQLFQLAKGKNIKEQNRSFIYKMIDQNKEFVGDQVLDIKILEDKPAAQQSSAPNESKAGEQPVSSKKKKNKRTQKDIKKAEEVSVAAQNTQKQKAVNKKKQKNKEKNEGKPKSETSANKKLKLKK